MLQNSLGSDAGPAAVSSSLPAPPLPLRPSSRSQSGDLLKHNTLHLQFVLFLTDTWHIIISQTQTSYFIHLYLKCAMNGTWTHYCRASINTVMSFVSAVQRCISRALCAILSVVTSVLRDPSSAVMLLHA